MINQMKKKSPRKTIKQNWKTIIKQLFKQMVKLNTNG